MKKTLATLGLAGMLALLPKAQAGITPKTEETKKDLIEAIITEQATPEEDGKTISFEDAKDLQEQLLFEELLEVERFQELVNEYGEEQVREALKELLSSEETEEVVKYLLSDQKIQRALEEGDGDAVVERILKILRTYYGLRTVTKLSCAILCILFFVYQIRDLKGWHYVIGKRKK